VVSGVLIGNDAVDDLQNRRKSFAQANLVGTEGTEVETRMYPCASPRSLLPLLRLLISFDSSVSYSYAESPGSIGYKSLSFWYVMSNSMYEVTHSLLYRYQRSLGRALCPSNYLSDVSFPHTFRLSGIVRFPPNAFSTLTEKCALLRPK